MFSFLRWRRNKPPASAEKAPFPTRQLFVLALCRLAEPIAFMSIFPYIYFMIREFHVTDDEHRIAIYAGMVTSSFAFAEFSTSVLWGRLSDRIGRKPVLLTGLAGTGLSMISFGFAPSLPMALVARALGGLLNGNIGVIHTTVAEVATVEAHQPRAYSIMPFVWSFGSILGYSLGGVLAEPAKNFPQYFSTGSIFAKYPFLLPNLVCTVVVLMSLIVGILFLEETHEDKKHKRDIGLECGDRILRCLRKTQQLCASEKNGYTDVAYSPLDGEDQPPGYRTTDGTPRSSSSVESRDAARPATSQPAAGKMSIRQALTGPMVLIITGYGLLALHTISLEQLLPVLMSMPESDEVSLPWKFTSGFGFETKFIGMILSIQGVFQMVVQVLVFPVITKRFGSLRTLRGVVLLYPVMYCAVPYVPLLPQILRMPILYLILLMKVTGQSLAFPSVLVILRGAAPSTRVLGTLNGLAASSASLARAIGPTLAGVVQSTGLRLGYSGIAWWLCASVAIVGAVQTIWMQDSPPVPSTLFHGPSVDEEATMQSLLIDSDMSDADSHFPSRTFEPRIRLATDSKSDL